MTSPYEADGTPDEVEIRCPRCARLARFHFAVAAFLASNEDKPVVAQHAAFDLASSSSRHHMNAPVAIYYADLDSNPTVSFDGTSVARYVFREFADRGACLCTGCGLRRRHRLSWPEDAWFSCEVRGQVLWAWTRDHAVVLRDYIAARDRNRDRFRHRIFLQHIPSHFLRARHRDEAVRKLDRLLRSE